MELKLVALVTASALASALFVGCACTKSVDNGEDDAALIEIDSDVTISSEAVTETTFSETNLSDVTTTSGTGTSDTSETGNTETTVSKKVQFVGNTGGRNTTRATAATRVVIVTVTRPKTTAATAAATTVPTTVLTEATTTTLATVNMPDGLFTPTTDLCFTFDGKTMQVGGTQSELVSMAKDKVPATPTNGGVAANLYIFDGFSITTETIGGLEQITDIKITENKACTNKGVTVGDSIDDIHAAYGTEKCEVADGVTYRYKTDDGFVLDFITNGFTVTGISYYKTAPEA